MHAYSFSFVMLLQAKGGITPDIVEALTKNNVTLSKMRKKRQISETLATPDDVSQLDLAGSFPIHKTTQVECLSLAQVVAMCSVVKFKTYLFPFTHPGQQLGNNVL